MRSERIISDEMLIERMRGAAKSYGDAKEQRDTALATIEATLIDFNSDDVRNLLESADKEITVFESKFELLLLTKTGFMLFNKSISLDDVVKLLVEVNADTEKLSKNFWCEVQKLIDTAPPLRG